MPSERRRLSKDDVLRKAKEEDVKFIHLLITDILGATKNITIPVSRLEKALDEGIFFDGSSILGYATIEESDMRAVPIPETYVIIPWTNDELRSAMMVCNVYDHKGRRFEGDPRYVLSRAVEKAKKLGYTMMMGPEFEFFLFKVDDDGNPTDIPSDYGTYFDLMRDRGDEVRKDIVNYLEMMGYRVEASHHEVAQGQHEIDLVYTDAMTMADRVSIMKYVIKRTAEMHNLYATFMPKPIYGQNGSGMHTHLSLWKDGRNSFYDPSKKYELSDDAMYFIGGLLRYARETCAILAPCVNSYKRLVPGYEAPTYISWANTNRSALIRVPAGRGDKTRIELRNPDPSGNPYLQFAVMLTAGLNGILEEISPPEPVEKDIYHLTEEEKAKLGIKPLPGTLGEAISEAMSSELIRETLGEHVFHHYFYLKKKEWEEYRAQVHPWELEKYLGIL